MWTCWKLLSMMRITLQRILFPDTIAKESNSTSLSRLSNFLMTFLNTYNFTESFLNLFNQTVDLNLTLCHVECHRVWKHDQTKSSALVKAEGSFARAKKMWSFWEPVNNGEYSGPTVRQRQAGDKIQSVVRPQLTQNRQWKELAGRGLIGHLATGGCTKGSNILLTAYIWATRSASLRGRWCVWRLDDRRTGTHMSTATPGNEQTQGQTGR